MGVPSKRQPLAPVSRSPLWLILGKVGGGYSQHMLPPQALLCSFPGVPASLRLRQGTGLPEPDLSWSGKGMHLPSPWYDGAVEEWRRGWQQRLGSSRGGGWGRVWGEAEEHSAKPGLELM